MEQGCTLSSRLFFARHYVCGQPHAAAGLATRHCTRDRVAVRYHGGVQARNVQHAGRFADLRGTLFQPYRSRSWREDAGASRPSRGCAEVPRDDARAVESAPRACDAGEQVVRLASLRPLRLPALAVGRTGRQWHGTSSVQREWTRRRLPHRVEGRRAGSRPAAARVHAFVERQVPSSRRPVDAQLQRADGRLAALGVRGADAILGLRADRALGHVVGTGVLRCACDDRCQLRHQSSGFRLAHDGGHDQRSDRRAPHGSAVSQLAAERGLLQRRADDVARRRRPHPRAHA